QKLDLTAENTALGVDLLDRQLGADHLIAGRCRVDPGQRVHHAHADRRLAAGRDHEGRGQLRNRGKTGGLEHVAAITPRKQLMLQPVSPTGPATFSPGRIVCTVNILSGSPFAGCASPANTELMSSWSPGR